MILPARLLPIALIVFIDVLGFTVVIPLLPFYAEAYGASPLAVGALISLYALCSLVAGPILGRASDRYGRRPVLLLSQCGTLLGFVMLALAPSLAWLYIARAIDGLSAGNVATARAYISDVTPPKERSAAFGLIAAAFSFGYLVGPASAGLLARYGHAVPLWAAAGLSAVSIACTWFLLPRTPRPVPVARDAAAPRLWHTPGLRPLLNQVLAFFLAFSLFVAGLALFCERRLSVDGVAYGAYEVGLVLAYIGLLGLITQLFVLRPLVARVSERTLVRASLGAGALAYLGLTQAHALPWLLVCLGVIGVANSLLRPALFGLISQQVGPQQQGAVFGLTQSLQAGASIAGPLMAGALIHAGWLSGWALACALPLLLVLAWPPRK